MKDLCFLLDPLLSVYGSSTVAILGKRFNNNNVRLVSPIIAKDIEAYLRSQGFIVYSMNKKYRSKGSLLTFEGWFKNLEFNDGINDSIIINFSQCFVNYSHIYYAGGPMLSALDDIYPEMSSNYKLFYKLARPFIAYRDKKFNKLLRNHTKLFITVSRYCARLYRELGINVDSIIYPPIDTTLFKPSTSSPKEDYVLTYIGKESKYSILGKIAKQGIKIKGFGSKSPFVPSYISNNPNIEILGEVSNKELVELYSNALYTIFPFTHEPFGYVPLESIACSTPVLTYNKQGPSESILHGKTGWLANNDEELIELAIKLWKNGYDRSIRYNSRKKAEEFSLDKIAEEWSYIINRFN